MATDECNYLSFDDIMTIHLVILGNLESRVHLHNELGLSSAVAQPKQSAFGEMCYPSLYDKAAAYMFFITKNHPFFDCNKRTAFISGLIFLKKNGVELQLNKDEGHILMLRIARNQADISEISEFLKSNTLVENYHSSLRP